jgi:hypothetical protein
MNASDYVEMKKQDSIRDPASTSPSPAITNFVKTCLYKEHQILVKVWPDNFNRSAEEPGQPTKFKLFAAKVFPY